MPREPAVTRPDYTGARAVSGTVTSPRLASVDVFRGLTMAAMVIVNTPGSWSHVYAPLLHAPWHGWTPTDLIFPFFVFIVGVSIVLSGRSRGSVSGILRRAALLYGLGLFLALYPSFNFATVRLVGVLPRLALCYLAAALIYRQVSERDDRRQMLVSLSVAAVLLIGYWALLRFVPAPGGVAGDLSPAGNLGAWIDRTVIGEAHLWRQSKTWDPEGLLSTLPAIATALTGVAAGLVMRQATVRPAQLKWLVGAGILAMAAGLIWDRSFPINKNLWTSSYVLLTSGMAAVALVLCHWIVDRRDATNWQVFRTFVVLGRNALALFVISGLLVKTLGWIKISTGGDSRVSLYTWIYQHAFAPWAQPKNSSLFFALAALLLLYVLLEWMYRRRWFLRV
jgi:predicted acyltransferase